MSVYLLSKCTGFSCDKYINALNMFGHSELRISINKVKYTHILRYSPISRGNVEMGTWNCMWDENQQLSELERV